MCEVCGTLCYYTDWVFRGQKTKNKYIHVNQHKCMKFVDLCGCHGHKHTASLTGYVVSTSVVRGHCYKDEISQL